MRQEALFLIKRDETTALVKGTYPDRPHGTVARGSRYPSGEAVSLVGRFAVQEPETP